MDCSMIRKYRFGFYYSGQHKEEFPMKTRLIAYFVFAGALSLLLAACGGGGGGGGGFFPVNSLTMVPDKTKALASGTEDVTMTATVRDFSGQPLANKSISFMITSGTATLHSADVVTSASGTASVKVNTGPIAPPATSETVTVKATSAGASGSASVKFINLPSQATVLVGFTKAVSDIGTLTFDLVSTPSPSPLPVVTAIGPADTPPFINGVNTFASIINGPDTFSLLTSLIPGVSVNANTAFMQFVFFIDPSITALPTYAIGPNNITAFHSDGITAITPALVQKDFYSTTTFDTE
jgi:hypothetical protein